MAVESGEMTRCAICGAVNRPGTRFCRECGAGLGSAALGGAVQASTGISAPAPGNPAPGNPAAGDLAAGDLAAGASLSDASAAQPAAAFPTCSRCGKPLRVGARFCGACGATTGELQLPEVEMDDCPNCGAKLRAGARFCRICGQTIAPAAPPKVAAGPSGSMTCPACGHVLRAGARFCSACRTVIVPPELVVPPLPSAPPEPTVVTVDPPVANNFINRDVMGNILPLSELGGRYIIMQKVAKGGMGAVYRATDKRLGGNPVAIKETNELAVPEMERAKVVDLFKREAELLATLHHPNLVRVSDSFQIEHYHYMAMEFIEGKTVQGLLEAALDPFAEERVLKWALQLCDVLAYLHGQDPQIIYRDMKPANVMIVEGKDDVKLIDFGIARFHKPGKRRDTVQFGTDGYAPPEQYGKMQTDERSDVYALGAMLHQLLTLRDPQSELFTFPPVWRLNTKVTAQVAGAIDKAVQTNRDDRHQSIVAFRCALLGQPEPAKAEPASGRAGYKSVDLKRKDAKADDAGKADAVGDVFDLGRVKRGASRTVGTLTVPVPAGKKVAVSSNQPWLEVSRDTVDFASPDVKLILHASRLALGRLKLGGGLIRWWAGLHTRLLVPAARSHTAQITCSHGPGSKLTSQVVVEVVPRAFWVMVGWLLTLLLLLVELGIVLAAFAYGLSVA